MMKRSVLISSLLLGGCVTTSEPDAVTVTASVADTRNAQIADATARELAHLARFNPDRLDTVSGELRALAAALVGQSTVPTEDSVVLLNTAELAPPPAGFEQAASLRHGIHLASYRIHDNAVSGWAELQEQFPDILGDARGRLEEADIDGQGVYLRLKAGPYDTLAQARAACSAIEADGYYCMPVDFSGVDLAAAD